MMETQNPAGAPEQQTIPPPPPASSTMQAQPVPSISTLDNEIAACAAQVASGRSWINTIAGLTAINAILCYIPVSLNFIFGIFTARVIQ